MEHSWGRWPDLQNSYKRLIVNPMDITTIAVKVKSGQYSSFAALERDLDLIHDNTLFLNIRDIQASYGDMQSPCQIRHRIKLELGTLIQQMIVRK